MTAQALERAARHLAGAVALCAIIAAWHPAAASEPSAPLPPVSVVYQFSEGNDQARRGLWNIRNELDAEPDSRIVAVAFAAGVRFLLKGAKTEGGYPFELLVEELRDNGVRFEVCRHSLQEMHIDPDQLIEGVDIVPSGAAEIVRLQAREGFAYFRP